MRSAVLSLVLAALWLGLVQPGVAAPVLPKPAPGVFFVALNGNDQWSGLRPSPNWGKTDGPFATLPRALQAARQWRQLQGSGTAQPSVYVRGGLHFLTAPLLLQPEDSGLTLAAYGGEKPVLSGGRRITGWRPVAEGNRTLWRTEIPDVRSGAWYFRELWVNGQRAVRARHPNHGYLKIDHLLDTVPDWMHGHMRLRFLTNDLRAWKTVTQAEVVVMDRWNESRLPVFSVDEIDRIASFEKRSVFQLGPGDLYYLEGAFEALDAPGEWFLDRYSGTLSYLPRPGETLQDFEAIAPRLEQIVRLEGRPEAAQWVAQVRFRDLAFAHNEWYFSETAGGATNTVLRDESGVELGGFSQSAFGVAGAVWGTGARACTFENCRFSHLGSYALELARGCQTNRVLGCEFFDLGAGAIKLGETLMRDQEAEQSRANEISDCHIQDGGQLFPSAAGIWVGQSSDNLITHNL
ncbi:MAG TPA: right-handed parallel beta-helix repeat-containing protein, partial [Candidatus Sulfotelmatobacter sp.]|nr:right-handed parallel beta-helix repeat-containing protein [Candidatus Sulfotelmatobacter sp.]